jgi:hypothetical protein
MSSRRSKTNEHSIGQQLAVLGYLYGVDIEESLATILPPGAEK